MNNSPSAADQHPQSGPPYRRQLLILSIVVGAILLFIAIAILVYLGLRGPARPGALTPTPPRNTIPTGTRAVSPISPPSCRAIVSTGNVEVSLALPVSVKVGDTASYPVEPIVPQVEAWTYPSGYSDSAVWVCGTVVNYIVGLQPTAANQDLMANTEPGEQITLQLSNGTALLFRVAEKREVAPGAEAAVAQQQPRLTLVLPGDETWEIAVADYAAEAASAEPGPTGTTAEPGQAAEVDGARVTLMRSYVEESDNAPPDTTYFLVEFSVQNVGEGPLQTDAFSMKLRDSLGNTYLVAPRVSERGEFGPLSGEIPSGATAQGSAGYVVPKPLPTGELNWIFSPRPDAESVNVGIPYEAAGDVVALQPDVTITDAFLSDDGDTLVIEGEVLNRDTDVLVVDRSEIRLSSGGGTAELITTAPPLPWRIQPGQVQVIELQYQRPDAATVVLQLLGYSFEIGGL